MSNLSEDEIINRIKAAIEKDKKHRIETIYDEKPLFRDILQDLLDLYNKEKEKNKELKEKNKKLENEYINPSKARFSYYDNTKRMEILINGFTANSKLKEIIYPTPENPIPFEVQTSEMYKKLEKLVEGE